MYLDVNHNVFITGTYKRFPKEKQPHHILSNVQGIQCGIHSGVFCMQNGEVKVFGENANRQISSMINHVPVIMKPKTIPIEFPISI